MKFKKSISILVLIVAILTAAACLAGLLSQGGPGPYEFRSINNEPVKIYGSGLYKNDSVSLVAQGKATDLITLAVGVPLLLMSLFYYRRRSLKGRLMLTGTLGYFLYTYMSYAFLWTYNPLFILYVIIMSCSFFAFVLALMSFDMKHLAQQFSSQLPVRFLAGFQFFLAFILLALWLGRLAPSVLSGEVPVGLEHYTTLVIQAMDLGFIVPTAILSGILLIRLHPFGFLLSSVLITKGFTMLTCMSAMIVNMALNDVPMSVVEMVIFPIFNILAAVCLILLLKNTNAVENDSALN